MRVLLIEDDHATAQSIELMLKSEGFNVYTTDLGEEGIDLGKIYDYDLILLDLNLPDMNGFEVGQRIHELQPQCALIYCSAHNERSHRDRAFNEGAIDFIEKPFEVSATRQRLDESLQAAQGEAA